MAPKLRVPGSDIVSRRPLLPFQSSNTSNVIDETTSSLPFPPLQIVPRPSSSAWVRRTSLISHSPVESTLSQRPPWGSHSLGTAIKSTLHTRLPKAEIRRPISFVLDHTHQHQTAFEHISLSYPRPPSFYSPPCSIPLVGTGTGYLNRHRHWRHASTFRLHGEVLDPSLIPTTSPGRNRNDVSHLSKHVSYTLLAR